MEPVAKRSFATPTKLVGCVRNIAGRAFGASCMPRYNTDAPSVHLAAPGAGGGVEDADENPSFARGSMVQEMFGTMPFGRENCGGDAVALEAA
jgi:hypothetical protein